MSEQKNVNLYEAYASIYASQEELTEEVQIAAQYFYEMGLNEDGVDILIEELGVEEFAEFVYDIAEEYVLTEARAGGVKIEVKTAKGKEIQGKPTAQSLKALRKKKAARAEAEQSASDAKPSGMKASLQRQSAVAAAAKKQPKKPGLLDRVAGAVNRGIERHNAAMGELQKMKAATAVTAGKVKKAAGEFKKGLTSEEVEVLDETRFEGDLFDYILEHLVAEGYADTEEAALVIMANMSEGWRQSIVEDGFNSSGRYDVGGGRTVGPVAGAVRSLFSGNLPKGQTYVPPTKQTGPNRPPAVPASKNDSGKLTDFGAGGGKAKLKTGMSVGQVERQGRMNKGDYSG